MVHLCYFYSSGIYIKIKASLAKAHRQLSVDYSLCNAHIWKRTESSRPTSYDNNYLSVATYYYSFVQRLPPTRGISTFARQTFCRPSIGLSIYYVLIIFTHYILYGASFCVQQRLQTGAGNEFYIVHPYIIIIYKHPAAYYWPPMSVKKITVRRRASMPRDDSRIENSI